MTTVILGAGGRLASAFAQLYPDAALIGRDRLDLRDQEAIGRVLGELAPHRILNCAAYNHVDAAEADPESAHAINATAVGTLAAKAAELGAQFATFSTDYVFNGRSAEPYVEASPTGPLNTYGRSKLAGEELAFAVKPDTLVVRTAWLTSPSHPSFVARYLAQGVHGTFRVVDDQRGRPTVAEDLAQAVDWALDAGVTGLVHVTNAGPVVSRYDLARSVLEWAGLDPDLVEACSSEDFPNTAARPKFSALATARPEFAAAGLLPSWEGGVKQISQRVIEEMRERPAR